MKHIDQATTLITELTSQLSEADLAKPSLLPGWSRGTVLSHLSRNAEAIGNLAHWAKTGEPTPMYSSPTQRETDIHAGENRAIDEQLADFQSTAKALSEQFDALTEYDWDSPVQTNSGRTVAARAIRGMRVKELWVHAVDLDLGFGFTDWPSELVETTLRDVAGMVGRKHTGQALLLRPTDADLFLTVGTGRAIEVTASAATLLAWVTGRGGAPDADLPALPDWL